MKSKFIRVKSAENIPIAPKSRLDRGYGPEGQGFESLTAYQAAVNKLFTAVFILVTRLTASAAGRFLFFPDSLAVPLAAAFPMWYDNSTKQNLR